MHTPQRLTIAVENSPHISFQMSNMRLAQNSPDSLASQATTADLSPHGDMDCDISPNCVGSISLQLDDIHNQTCDATDYFDQRRDSLCSDGHAENARAPQRGVTRILSEEEASCESPERKKIKGNKRPLAGNSFRNQRSLSNFEPRSKRAHSPVRRCLSQNDIGEPSTPKRRLDVFTDNDVECNISVDLVAGIARGEDKYRKMYDKVIIVDCRYRYEYEGGHIHVEPDLDGWLEVIHFTPCQHKAAINYLFPSDSEHVVWNDRVCLIFHCEYSQKRGPAMLKSIIEHDRKMMGEERYPLVHYPETYVMGKGYKEFFLKYKELCNPQTYIPENDPRFTDMCKQATRQRKMSKKGMEPGAAL
ncbi:hypothetical protein GUITHDRAFT_143582 [Guillardia theta CCMP2712]|uniref:protein-tyrosine-phosphatase n=1 Tax=Guillardia theta (strain CCMP2712) TaxID=905079 RepID=L1IT03_GUITC|nr:hypothetical protein GUITHDRAFT_143582 [Guillardia theta CCMP2712]EKX39386.1 hypothetical protein GUITHDRAFT_143582 [Guillardia theta CCMP2712]|eukprot:XP_005826366.1 hypothetical protein GUITHDRAFT_143582 [Guillardia theta CCMP2712]